MRPTSLGFGTDLELLRLAGSEVVDRGDHLVIRSPHNPSHWWGNFLLLSAVPDDADCPGWLDRFAAEFPHAQHVALGFEGVDGSVEQLGWFAVRGFDVDESTVLTASPPTLRPPRRPNTVADVRPMESDTDWAQAAELRIRCWDGPTDPQLVEYSTARTATFRRLAESGAGAWFGAFVDGRLVSHLGVVRAGEGVVRYQSVETDPGWRRQGLAGTLVHAAGTHGVDALGAQRLVIVADPDYVAVRLYRDLGFVDAERQLQAIRPQVV